MPPDVIADIVHEIENLTEPKAHSALADQLEIGPMSDFKIGGLLSLIKSNSWFQGYPKFEDYVANKVEPTTGVGYRKALYLVEIYDAIVESGLAWDKVKGIGWTKLQIIARVLKRAIPSSGCRSPRSRTRSPWSARSRKRSRAATRRSSKARRPRSRLL